MPNHINGSHVNFCNPLDEITCVIARQEPQSKREGKAAHADADGRERGTRCFTHTSPQEPGKAARRTLMRIRQSCSAASSPTRIRQRRSARRTRRKSGRVAPHVAPPTRIRQSCSPASLLMSIAAASPRCSARYENRVPPDPYVKPYHQAGLQARTIHRKRYLRIFRANVIAVGRQTISLGEKCARKADRRKQTAKITQKTEVYIFILPHQSRKSNGTECKYAICLHSRPSRKAKHCCLATHIAFIAFSTKNFTPIRLLKNVDIMTMTFVSLSVTQVLS